MSYWAVRDCSEFMGGAVAPIFRTRVGLANDPRTLSNR